MRIVVDLVSAHHRHYPSVPADRRTDIGKAAEIQDELAPVLTRTVQMRTKDDKGI